MEDGMAAEIHRLRDKAGETEKITINVGYVDLGHIDLLLFQPHRLHSDRDPQPACGSCRGSQEIDCAAYAGALLRHFTRADLEAAKAAGEKLHIKVLGLTSTAPDVSPELALATIESITVLGALHASKEIKSALADRIG